MARWHVYLLLCRDGSLYCGVAADLARRVSEHNSGRGAKYVVPARRPAVCVWRRAVADRSRAQRLEYWIKSLDVADKWNLVEKRATLRAAPGGGWKLRRNGAGT